MPPQTPSLSEVIEGFIEHAMDNVFTAMPGQIVSFDVANCVANVRPLIKQAHTREDGSRYANAIPVIPSVPVIFPGSGHSGITFPVKAGDTCLLVFCNSSLDAWKLGRGDKPVDPGNDRRHNLNDAVAILGLRTMSAARNSPATTVENNAVIVHADGKLLLGGQGETSPVIRKADINDLRDLLDAAAASMITANPSGAAAVEAVSDALGGWAILLTSRVEAQ